MQPEPPVKPIASDTSRPPLGSGDIFDQLLSFTGPASEYSALLLASAFSSGMLRQGVVFMWDDEKKTPLIENAIPPLAPGSVPSWLTPLFESLPGSPNDSRTRILPRKTGASGTDAGAGKPGGTGVKPLAESTYLAFEMGEIRQESLPPFLMNLEMLGALWRSYRTRTGGGPATDAEILAPAVSALSVVNAARKFPKFAMTLCNELASRFGCDRVSLGILKGRYVRLAAMSNTEKFGKGVELVQAVEAAMEECLDQDTEIVYPGDPRSSGISRAAEQLSRRFDSSCVVSVPVREGDRARAVLTLERMSPRPPDARDVKLLRLIADLIAPRLLELNRHDRWFGARLAAWLRDKLALALGHKHTWAKLAALACAAAIAFLCVAQGMYRVEATFVTKPVEQRVVAAPYDGFLATVNTRPGEKVVADASVLAELETAELKSRLAMKRAEMSGHLKDAGLARRENKFAEAQAAEARAEQAEAECDLLEEKIAQARVRSPLDGVVLSGDWTTRIGAPVKLGDTLFEVAPLSRMEADLYVPEDEIADVKEGQIGMLAAAGRPDEKIGFEVVRITPLAEMVKQKNVFRVQVRLTDPPEWMLPGLEGVAKIDVEQRNLALIWSRRAVNWVKMKLWLWW